MVLHSAAQLSAVLPNIAFEPIGYPGPGVDGHRGVLIVTLHSDMARAHGKGGYHERALRVRSLNPVSMMTAVGQTA